MADVIVNGGFSADSNWTKGTGWTISGGLARMTSAPGSNSWLSQAGLLTVGVPYIVTADVVVTTGATGPDIDGTNKQVSSSGSYTWVCYAIQATFEWIATSTFTGTVDNITCTPLSDTEPAFQAAGTEFGSQSGVTPTWPTHISGDVALLLIESAGGEAATLSTANGFQAVTNSPSSTGTLTAGTRITAFWHRATSSSMSAPITNDPGNHIYARILTFRGCIATGDPWDITAAAQKASASTSASAPGVTTTVAKTCVVNIIARDTDSAAAAFSAWANADLADIMEVSDAGTALGTGGGYAVAVGRKASAGTVGATTATVSSSINASLTIALKPPISSAPGVADSDGVGAGAAVGISTARSTGDSTTSVSVATGVGRSTARSDSTAAGIAAAAAVGRAVYQAVASASGAATVAALSNKIMHSVGASAGEATAQATGRSSAASLGASSGSSTAASAARSTAASVFAAAGVADGDAEGTFTNQDLIASAAGVAAVAGVGRSTARGSVSADGISTAAAVGASIVRAVAAAAGSSTTGYFAQGGSSGAGSASGSSTAAATGRSTTRAVALSAGISTTSSTGRSNATAIGTATGSANVNATSEVLAQSVAFAAGSSENIGISDDTILEPEDIAAVVKRWRRLRAKARLNP
jgi:hypothetical protein